jgi:hypothetical protein
VDAEVKTGAGVRTGRSAAGDRIGSGPPRPAFELASCWAIRVEAPFRLGARETSKVEELKADPIVRDIGEPTGSKA